MASISKIHFELHLVVPKKRPKKMRKLIYDLAKFVSRKLIREAIEMILEFLKNLICLKSRTKRQKS